MRGLYTAGVLDVFIDNNITFDGIMGVSAGALFGISYASRQRGRSLRYSQKYNSDKRYISVGSLLRTGNIVNTEFAYGTMPHKLDPFDNETFMASGVDFWAVVTDIHTGLPEYIQVTDCFAQMDVLRASGSMPFFSAPVEIDGRQYLDGGISDAIPYRKMRQLGYDRLVVVVTRDEGYVKEPMSPGLIKMFYHKYPEFERVMIGRHRDYNKCVRRLKKLEEQDKLYVIRPTVPLEIKRLEKDPAKMQAVYDVGVSDALAVAEQVKEYIRKN